MFKFIIATLFASSACVSAKPGFFVSIAHSAPRITAPAFVTASSSQIIARNYNGMAAAKLVVYSAPVLAQGTVRAQIKYIAAPAAISASKVKYNAPQPASAETPEKYTSAPSSVETEPKKYEYNAPSSDNAVEVFKP